MQCRVCIIVREKGCNQETLISAFGPPVTTTCLNSYGAKHKKTMCYGNDAVQVGAGGRDGRAECSNQIRLVTHLFPHDDTHPALHFYGRNDL
ncbi:hypothetical protein Y032_0026g1383 [Ancylostoma ceylanicum]|uniref:Uncharacterized protein n=1 Tax=Ancylostoma ceylanicum TaxID=53326 RepID=A0A016UVJ3_9BILA|nr:hypothetical protein Y032_0026g1383 [Ancylostoma ceylanicum]